MSGTAIVKKFFMILLITQGGELKMLEKDDLEKKPTIIANGRKTLPRTIRMDGGPARSSCTRKNPLVADVNRGRKQWGLDGGSAGRQWKELQKKKRVRGRS